jgi:hypothetical protein
VSDHIIRKWILCSQPVDFTRIKSRTSNFLKDIFTHLFIARQVSVPALGTPSFGGSIHQSHTDSGFGNGFGLFSVGDGSAER